MRKDWTELELTIVYYVTEYGPHGCIKSPSGFMSGNEIIEYLGHGKESFSYCHNRFKSLLGYENANGRKYMYTSTKAQKAIVKKYANTTVSQLRLIISELSNELSLKSSDNTLPDKESSLERTKTALGGQLSFDF
tara:strand:+ start:132 stop:536 length:405 start_codon:yes stop_codon:yes gene_type:complete